MDLLMDVIEMGFILEMLFAFLLIYSLFSLYTMSKCRILAYTIITFWGILFWGTEFLDVFQTVTVLGIRILWLIVIIILLIICKYRKSKLSLHFFQYLNWKERSLYEKVLLATIGCILFLTFFMSLFSVVNNGDSLGYHLPRILHWLQDGTVNYYYSQDIRQIYAPILSEYALTHIFALCGNDSLLNLLQWFAYAISALYLYKISRMLKLSSCASLFSSLLFITMPMAIAQSMTTQVDLVGTMWVTLLIYLLLGVALAEDSEKGKDSLLSMGMASCCVGFAYITKTNACIPMLFICIWFLFYELVKKVKLIVIIRWILIAGVTMSLIILPGIIRNALYQGQWLSNPMSESVLIYTMNPRYVLVNMYKNISMESMQYLFAEVDNIILKMGGAFAELLNVDINSELIGYGTNDYYSTGSSLFYYFNHDYAGNPLVLTLGILSLFYLTLRFIRNKENRNEIIYGVTLAIICGFLVSTIVIRWQPWVTRLLMPSFSLLVIPITYLLEQAMIKLKSKEFVTGILICAVFVTSFNSFTYNIRIPLENIFSTKTKEQLYLYYQSDEYKGYQAILDEIEEKQYYNIGLGEKINFEYVIWSRLWGSQHNLEHVPLDGSVVCEMIPDCIVAFGYNEGDSVTLNKFEYRYRIIEENDCGIYGLFIKHAVMEEE